MMERLSGYIFPLKMIRYWKYLTVFRTESAIVLKNNFIANPSTKQKI